MALLIHAAEIEQQILAREIDPITYMRESVNRVEEALCDAARDPAMNHPRRRINYHHGNGERQVRINSFVGCTPSRNYMGAFLRVDNFNLLPERVRHVREHKGKGFFILYDLETGAALAIIAADVRRDVSPVEAAIHVRTVRTSASSLVGTRAMIRPAARTLGFFGSGYFAAGHLLAVKAVLPIDKVKVYSPTQANRERFAREMGEFLELDVVPVATAREAVTGVDAIITTTSANEPVFAGDWLEPGQHVTCIVGENKALGRGRREIDDETVQRAGRIAIISNEQLRQDEQETFFVPFAKGIIRPEEIADIGQLLIGATHGRTSDAEITLFHNNAGQGVTDVAVAGYMYELARKFGLGTEI